MTTTLYDLVETLQEMLEPDDDALIVALVIDWLQAGRLRFQQQPTMSGTLPLLLSLREQDDPSC